MSVRSLSELSGPWVGFWIQQPIRGWMKMELGFSSGRIVGGGTDQIGPFTIQGEFNEAGPVKFRKRYASHLVYYNGKWDGQMIYGTWKITWYDSGEFEIWPEAEFEALNLGEHEIEQELIPT